MLNFTVGPVMLDEQMLELGGKQIPYFRTSDFSEIMKDNERLMKMFADAEPKTRAVFLTASGTGAMEAAVANALSEKDKVLVINGGSFGQRFVELCKVYHISYTDILLKNGENLTHDTLKGYDNRGYTALLVNICETSTGILYPLTLLSDFCKRNQLLFIVDAVSAFIADPISMKQSGIDVFLTGSQKALAVPPGISILLLGEKALKRIGKSEARTLYFNLKNYLKDGERGQTPYTPAVGTLLQIHERLRSIEKRGIINESAKIGSLAADFRERVRPLPFTIAIPEELLSNCVTPLKVPEAISAYFIFEILRSEYDIFICPNGGELRDSQFRVGHLGALTVEDNKTLVNAFYDLVKRGIL